MQKHLCILLFITFGLSSSSSAQLASLSARFIKKLNFNIGLNGGASTLFHNTNFKNNSKLQSLYEVVAFSHTPAGSYTWEMFEETYQMNTSFSQPRFGFSADLSFDGLPIHVIADWMSSTSSYESMSSGVTVALGHDFEVGDNVGLYISVMGGMKYVINDSGWGSATLINSFGEPKIRENLNNFFDPVAPLGTNSGKLFVLRGGIGKTIGESENIKIGVECYGELDATERIKRQSRMTNIGGHVYLRFNLLGSWSSFDNTFYPNPNGK